VAVGGTLRAPGAAAGAAALAVTGLVVAWSLPAAGVVLCAVGALIALVALATSLLARPARWLALYTWLLPFHVLVVAVLFGGLGVPEPIVRGVAAWKEISVVLVVACVAVRTLAGRGAAGAFCWVDFAAGAFILLNLAYFVGQNVLFETRVALMPQLYGLRDSAFFTVLYFVGRATPEVAEGDRVLRRLFLVGVVTSVIAILERLFVPPELLVLLGATRYYQEFLGIGAITNNNDYGLIAMYWTQMGSVQVRRAASVYLVTMSFAVVFLLVIPAATVWLRTRQNRPLLDRAVGWLGYALVWTGLLLSITRMSILTCLFQIALIAVLTRSPRMLTGMATTGVVLFLIALAAVPRLPAFVWQTLTWQTGSSESHLAGWLTGLQSAVRNPLGHGLGTGDLAARFGGAALSSDNVYLKYAVEIGFVGLLLHLLLLAGFVVSSWRLYQRGAADASRRFGLFVLVATVGVAANGLTTVIYNTPMLSYLFFWMAGAAVTLSQGATGVDGRRFAAVGSAS
jgi:hypothetical protein